MTGYYFSFVDSLFLGIYIFEIVIKVYVWRSSFVRNGWNNFDLFVVIMSLIEVLLLIVFGQLAGFDPKIFRLLRVFRAVRAFRALRVLRTITFFQNLQIIVSTLIQSIPAMASISLLIFLILYIFGIIGVTLYKDIYPERFGNIWLALFALFQLITLDNWFELYDDVRERDPYMIFYLIVFIIIETFIFINLFIAVIVSYLDHLQERNKLRIKRNLKKKKLALQRRQAQHELMNKKDKTTEAEDARQEIEMAGGIGINALSNKGALGMGTSFRDMEYTKQYYDETVPDPRQRYAINETLMLLASLEDSMHFYSGQQKLMDDLVDIVEKKN